MADFELEIGVDDDFATDFDGGPGMGDDLDADELDVDDLEVDELEVDELEAGEPDGD